MSFSLTFTRSCNDGSALVSNEVYAFGSGPRISEVIPINQTDLPLAFSFAIAKLQAIFIMSTCDMVVRTNAAAGAAQEVITLVAGVPYMWGRASSRIGAVAAPFAGDVTGLFVTTAAQVTGTLDIRASVDPT